MICREERAAYRDLEETLAAIERVGKAGENEIGNGDKGFIVRIEHNGMTYFSADQHFMKWAGLGPKSGKRFQFK